MAYLLNNFHMWSASASIFIAKVTEVKVKLAGSLYYLI
jgi:hypothetical protein